LVTDRIAELEKENAELRQLVENYNIALEAVTSLAYDALVRVGRAMEDEPLGRASAERT
jgi:hypothetical protein